MLQFSTDIILDALGLAAFCTSEDSKQVLRQFTDMYDKARYTKRGQPAIDMDADSLIEIVKDLVKSGTLDKKTEYNKIIVKVKSSPLAQKDPFMTGAVSDMLKQGMSEGLTLSRELELRRRIQNWCLISATSDKLNEGLSLCRRYSSNEAQNDLILASMLDKAHEITKIQETIIGATESIDELDFTSKVSMQSSADKYAKRKKVNVIKLGWQGLNRMMGINGGICRGELVGFAAPSYNGKSLMLMNIARWATVHNKYELNDPTKIPTVVLLSLENEISDDYNDMSKAAYVNAYHRPIPPELTKDELIEINYNYYNKCGNRLLLKRFGEDFGYADLVKLLARLEMRNMEVVCLVIDYPALMRQETSDKDNAAKILERLYQKLMDLAHSKDIAIVAGLQLDATADRLVSQGEVCAVKKLNSATLADSKGIKRALDVLIFQLIEHVDNIDYLTFSWNKHRNNAPPKTEDKFCAYRFDEMGILDDIDGKDLSVPDIYADSAVNNKEESDEEKPDFFADIKAI